MKTVTLKWIQRLGFLGAALQLAACAQPKLSPGLTSYQVQTNRALLGYAYNVSKGFLSSRGIASTRGGFFDSNNSASSSPISFPTTSGGITFPPLPTGYSTAPISGYLLQESITSEVMDCYNAVASVPKNCGNLDYAVGTLARCLNEIVNYRNPLMTYAFRNLDAAGQQYWAYLLNWHQAGTFDTFGNQQFTPLSGYASTGYVTQNY